jgi:hypothetical protein
MVLVAIVLAKPTRIAKPISPIHARSATKVIAPPCAVLVVDPMPIASEVVTRASTYVSSTRRTTQHHVQVVVHHNCKPLNLYMAVVVATIVVLLINLDFHGPINTGMA